MKAIVSFRTPGGYLLALAGLFSCGQPRAQEQSPLQFSKHQLSADFLSEGVAVADVNRDGLNDILAGAYYFLAPDWTPHELDQPKAYKANGGYSDTFLNFSMDVDQDGWTDLIRVDEPGESILWYQNPGGKKGHWPQHVIAEHAGNESPLFTDIDGDGRMDLLFNDPVRLEVLWMSPPPKGGTQWERHVISKDPEVATHKYTHGLGYGDLNGDGHKDVLVKDGWWEGPADPRQENWRFHKATLSKDCAQMYVFDVNGDGLNDILSSSAHNYGIWWQEQGKDARGNTTWTEHEIHTKLSQTHGLSFSDINGDGTPDLVTGKRYFAHNGHDPGAHEPAMLYWIEFKPGNPPQFTLHEIDNDSGVGLHVVVEDVNKDGLPDVVSANKKGVHYFQQGAASSR